MNHPDRFQKGTATIRLEPVFWIQKFKDFSDKILLQLHQRAFTTLLSPMIQTQLFLERLIRPLKIGRHSYSRCGNNTRAIPSCRAEFLFGQGFIAQGSCPRTTDLLLYMSPSKPRNNLVPVMAHGMVISHQRGWAVQFWFVSFCFPPPPSSSGLRS
jgi:hypothetical protein